MTYPPGAGGPYGPPPMQYGYGPQDPGAKNGAVVSLIVNICAVLFCCGILSIGGVICSAIALSKADYDPQSARQLVKWSWISLVASVVLAVLAVLAFFVLPFLGFAMFASETTY